MNIITVIIWLAISIACAVIHKDKGYSPISGFLWGAFFSGIALIIILLERNKDEVESQNGLSVLQWILVFVGIGIALFVLMCVFMKILN